METFWKGTRKSPCSYMFIVLYLFSPCWDTTFSIFLPSFTTILLFQKKNWLNVEFENWWHPTPSQGLGIWRGWENGNWVSKLMLVQKSGEHQVRLVVYPSIYKVLYIPGGDRRISEPSTVVKALWSSVCESATIFQRKHIRKQREPIALQKEPKISGRKLAKCSETDMPLCMQ